MNGTGIAGRGSLRADIQAAASALASLRKIPWYGRSVEIDLSGLSLPGVVLRRAPFRNARLERTNMAMADLRAAQMKGANLRDANLRRAWLAKADLSGTQLQGADLREVWGLTNVQLDAALVDENTKLPDKFAEYKVRRLTQEQPNDPARN